MEKTFRNTPNGAIDWYDLIEDKAISEELLTTSEYLVI